MKYWKKIFIYSVVLFVILLNLAGSLLIEKTFVDSRREALRAAVNKYVDIENNLYLNADYLIDVDVTNKASIQNWSDIIVKGYTLSMNEDSFFMELYTESNELISSDLNSRLTGSRQELIEAKPNEKQFIIRRMNGKRYVFVSSIINLKNTNFKLVLSKSIERIYSDRIADYKYFLLLSACISGILAIGMFVISKKLTKPIVNLSNISQTIAEGNYSIRIAESGAKDEIGVLERNFNGMIDVIEQNIMELRYHNQAKQRFIDSLSHEIKTPITSIIGYSDLLLRSKVNEETSRKALMYINSEAKRLEHLNSTLLKLTFLREQSLEKEIFSLSYCLEHATDALKYKLEKQKIELFVEVEEANLYGDKHQIEVLLINLIDNACKASKENGKISITGEYGEKSRGYKLRIQDYGIGMPMEEMDKILEPFYMVDKARTRKDNGIGLGLAICSEVCKNQNIIMSFTSEVGAGTQVCLTFSKERIVL
ncbi:MAG: HAMP domain-containing sensor histidine kinase [bacterium]|nr:HAMP domain-containing sensor histidine kinase [bacterium]